MGSSITQNMLAGGQEFNGLPTFSSVLKKKLERNIVALKDEAKSCKKLSVVLGLLAIIAAGGSAALIALSGGPSSLHFFATGCASGGLSTAFIVGIVAANILAWRLRKKLESDFVNDAGERVAYERIQEEMEKAELAQIVESLKLVPTEQKAAFMTWIYGQYFPEQSEHLLSEHGKKILSAFARYPEAINMDTAYVPEFARQMLAHIDPNEINTGRARLTTLIGCAGVPRNGEYEIFARHPLAVALLAQTQSERFDLHVVRAIYDQMNDSQKIIFLKQILDDLDALGSDETTSKQRGVLEGILFAAFEVVNIEFANQFNSNPIPAEKKELLNQMARSPSILADILANQSMDALSVPSFMDALAEVLGERSQVFIDEMVPHVKLLKFEKPLKDLMQASAAQNRPTPAIVRQICKQAPIAMAYVIQGIKGNALANIFAIICEMTPQQRTGFVCDLMLEEQRGISFYSDLSDKHKANFLQLLTDDYRDTEDATQKRHMMTAISKCIEATFTEEFAKKFENDPVSADTIELLQKALVWPRMTAACIVRKSQVGIHLQKAINTHLNLKPEQQESYHEVTYVESLALAMKNGNENYVKTEFISAFNTREVKKTLFLFLNTYPQYFTELVLEQAQMTAEFALFLLQRMEHVPRNDIIKQLDIPTFNQLINFLILEAKASDETKISESRVVLYETFLFHMNEAKKKRIKDLPRLEEAIQNFRSKN